MSAMVVEVTSPSSLGGRKDWRWEKAISSWSRAYDGEPPLQKRREQYHSCLGLLLRSL